MIREAKFCIGQVVKHRIYSFRGVIFDVDPVFNNTDAWYEAIPEDVRPHKNQPFYHLYAENGHSVYEAYVSEQNLLCDDSTTPITHPRVREKFVRSSDGSYQVRHSYAH